MKKILIGILFCYLLSQRIYGRLNYLLLFMQKSRISNKINFLNKKLNRVDINLLEKRLFLYKRCQESLLRDSELTLKQWVEENNIPGVSWEKFEKMYYIDKNIAKTFRFKRKLEKKRKLINTKLVVLLNNKNKF